MRELDNKAEEILKKIRTYPDILYKYRDWSNDFHKKLLTENQVFFSSAELLNDPFDTAIPLRFDKLSKKEIEKIYFETTNKKYPHLNRSQRKKLSKEVTTKALRNKDKLIEEYKKYQVEKNKKDYGIYSFAEKRNNIVMWSHYSNSHKGFCVGFDIKKLYQFIIKVGITHRIIFDMFKIEYEDFYPILIPSKMNTEEFIVKPLITKSKSWQYEDEYRLLLLSGTNYSVNLPENIIVEVILGCNIEDQSKSEIISLLKTKKESIELYQAKIAEEEFSLEFDQIEYQ